MGTGYTRNDTTNNIADGNVINAADLDGEFDAIVTALSTGGHTHDGTAAEGGPVTVLGPAQDFVVTASIVSPKTDNTLDLGTSTLEFKDIYIDGTAYIDGLGEDILVAGTSKIQFTNTSNYIHSASAGNIDLVAATEIHLTATTINMDGAADISGNLGVGGNLTVTGTTTFNGGTITMGDAASDNVVFGADINSDIIPNTDSAFDLGSSTQEWRDLFLDGTAHIDTLDVDVNATVAGTLGVTGVLTTTATQVATGGITSGSNIVSDTDSTDDLGTTSVRWANLFVDGITATDQITATGFTGTLDGILGSGTAAAATVTTLDTSDAVNLNLVTDSTSSTSGALIVDGGVGIAKKLFVGTDLDVDGTTNLDVVDIDGAVDMASTLAVTGIATFTDDIIIGDGKTIGSASDVDAIAIGADGDVTLTQDLELQHDGAILSFGANDEITVTHVADRGLTITNINTGDNKPIVLQLKSEEDIMQANELIASIEFAAGDSDGTDGATIAAGIHAIAEDDFSDTVNTTKLVFTTGASETAAFGATAKMTLSSAGLLTIADDFMIKDGGTIGVASTNDAITIASTGIVTFKDDILIKDAGTIGSASDPDAIAISSGGVVAISATTASTSSTTGSLTVGGGLGVAADLFVGDDLDVAGDAVIDLTCLVTGVLTTTAATVHNGGITMPDGAIAKFGTDTDMQIFHNGTSAFIRNSTGDLIFRTDRFRVLNEANSEQILHGDADGAVTAYFNNEVKLATKATGVTVTGQMAATTMDLSSYAVIDGTLAVGAALSSGYNMSVTGSVPFRAASTSTASTLTYGGVSVFRDKAGANQGTGISFHMDDDAGNITEYGYLGTIIEDDSNGAEDGSLAFYVTEGSTARARAPLKIQSNGRIAISNDIPIWSGSYGGAVFLKGNNSTAARHFRASIVDSNGSQDSSKHLTLDNDGDVTIGSGNLVIGTAGKGIDFSAGAGGNSSSNLLDEYEEGTWSPQIYYQNTTDQDNATNTTQTGYYTKIGRVVTLDFRLIWTITGSPANDNIGVKNLPFGGDSNTYSFAGVALPVNNSTTINTLVLSRPSDGGTIAVCESGDNTGNLGNEFGSGSGKEIRATIVYFTDA
jgi:hypothetical protein